MTREDHYSEIAERFGAIAGKYCDIVDSAPSLGKSELLARIYQILPALIDAAVHLPNTDSSEEDEENESDAAPVAARPADMSDDAWSEIYHSLQQRLGDSDLYWMVFDAVKDSDAIHGSLADDLADIYRDLKKGLILSEKTSAEDAIWNWRLHFDFHWGNHAMSALKAIQDIRNA